jgi:hypothetical protein
MNAVFQRRSGILTLTFHYNELDSVKALLRTPAGLLLMMEAERTIRW